MEKREKNSRKVKNTINIIMLIVIISFLILAVTMAKYFVKIEDKHKIESTSFYFNSDIIGEYHTEKWDGNNDLEINFNVNNYENSSLITDEDIKYNIEIEKIDDKNNEIESQIYENNIIIDKSNEQILNGKVANTKKYSLKVKKIKDITSQELNLKLKINSLSPYKQELIGNIKIDILQINDTIDTSFINEKEYGILKIKTNDVLENKTVTFDNTKLILDNANILLDGVSVATNNNMSSFIILKNSLRTNTEYEIFFVKKDNGNEIEIGKDIIIS